MEFTIVFGLFVAWLILTVLAFFVLLFVDKRKAAKALRDDGVRRSPNIRPSVPANPRATSPTPSPQPRSQPTPQAKPQPSGMNEGDFHSGPGGYEANTAYPDTQYGSGFADFDEDEQHR